MSAGTLTVRGYDTDPTGAWWIELAADGFAEPRVLGLGRVDVDDDCALSFKSTVDHAVVERLRGQGPRFPASRAEFDSQWVAARIFAALPVDRRSWLFRTDVKLHLLNSASGTDSEVKAELYSRFGGDYRAAVGTKAKPGPCYSIRADGKPHHWQALAVAVVAAERELGRMI